MAQIIDLTHDDSAKLYHMDIGREQVRRLCMAHSIASDLAMQATQRLLTVGSVGASLYVIDSFTNQGARITYVGLGTFDLKVSSRTGTALLEELATEMPALLDSIVIID